MHPQIAIFAVGNRSRGDDAIGPLLLERLDCALRAQAQTDRFLLIEDYQLQIEHALDLQGKRLALFIDAGYDTPAPFAFYALEPALGMVARNTHELSPPGVLEVYRQIARGVPPPAFVLCVRGERFELGEGLSQQAQLHVETAWQQLARLCEQPEARLWRGLINVSRAGLGTA